MCVCLCVCLCGAFSMCPIIAAMQQQQRIIATKIHQHQESCSFPPELLKAVELCALQFCRVQYSIFYSNDNIITNEC